MMTSHERAEIEYQHALYLSEGNFRAAEDLFSAVLDRVIAVYGRLKTMQDVAKERGDKLNETVAFIPVKRNADGTVTPQSDTVDVVRDGKVVGQATAEFLPSGYPDPASLRSPTWYE